MQPFILDERLAADCYSLGTLHGAELLLMNNAHFAWMILVPHTEHTEFYELARNEQQLILASINELSVFIKQHFACEKLNIATIGNVVRQLHIHVVGRNRNDPCWPGVVWGTQDSTAYTPETVQQIRSALAQALGDSFTSST